MALPDFGDLDAVTMVEEPLTESEQLEMDKFESGMLSESELSEAVRIKVNSKGEKIKRKKCAIGYKLQGNKCVKISSGEKLSRKKGGKRGAKKRRSQKSTINRLTKKAMKKREQRGL